MRIIDWSSDVCPSDLPPQSAVRLWRAGGIWADQCRTGHQGSRRSLVGADLVPQPARQDLCRRHPVGQSRGTLLQDTGRSPHVRPDREGALLIGSDIDVTMGFDQHMVIFIPSRSVKSRSEEHTSELQSLMRISYAVFCLKKKNIK